MKNSAKVQRGVLGFLLGFRENDTNLYDITRKVKAIFDPSWVLFFLKLRFNPCKAEEPLRDIELQGEEEKD